MALPNRKDDVAGGFQHACVTRTLLETRTVAWLAGRPTATPRIELALPRIVWDWKLDNRAHFCLARFKAPRAAHGDPRSSPDAIHQ